MFSTVVLGGSHQVPLRELCRPESLCANARSTIVPDPLENRPFISTAETTVPNKTRRCGVSPFTCTPAIMASIFFIPVSVRHFTVKQLRMCEYMSQRRLFTR
ncbi:unnamed protein product [Ectocarpus sp. 4 AP-2014]